MFQFLRLIRIQSTTDPPHSDVQTTNMFSSLHFFGNMQDGKSTRHNPSQIRQHVFVTDSKPDNIFTI